MTKTNVDILLNELKELKDEAKTNPQMAIKNLINMTNIYPEANLDEAIIDSDVAGRLNLMLAIKHRLINDLDSDYYHYVVMDAKQLEQLSESNDDYVCYDENEKIHKLTENDILEIISNIAYNLQNCM